MLSSPISKHMDLPLIRAARTSRAAAAIVLASALALAACGDSSPAAPSGSAIVTFRVADETFRVRLDTPDQIRAAEAARDGTGPRIPVGRILAGAQVNVGYSWYLEGVTFADAAIELCDGRPSDVERAGVGSANGQYCPWGARVVEIQRF
jgi:hypothetical protein